MNLDTKRIGPHFLGIGAPRCGTTWLHKMLSKHPGIWMPPIKELHYFDSIDPTIDEKAHVDSAAYRFKWMFLRRTMHYGGYLLRDFVEEAKSRARPDLRWDYAFFKPGGSLDWYRNLFDRPKEFGKITGEITPAYIMLSSDMIKTIKEQLNIKKIILLLRNPVYSTWSSLEKQTRDGQIQANENSIEDLVKRARSPLLFGRYNYVDNLERWLKHYDRNDIFIGFFEEVEQTPELLLSKIFSFLEVDDVSKQLSLEAKKRINAASGSLEAIPPEVKYELALIHHEQIDRLRKQVNGFSENWYAEIQEILKAPKNVKSAV